MDDGSAAKPATQTRLLPRETGTLLTFRDRVLGNWSQLADGGRKAQRWLAEESAEPCAWVDKYAGVQDEPAVPPGLPGGFPAWSWISLLNLPNFRAGLLCLPRRGCMPLHDHPGSLGLSLVLSGNPTIAQSDGAQPAADDVDDPPRLRGLSRTELRTRQIAFTFPHQNNIHGFSAGDTTAVLFNVMISRKAAPRHWLDAPAPLTSQPVHSRYGFAKARLSRYLMICAAIAAANPALGCNLDRAHKTLASGRPTVASQLLLPCADAGDAEAQAELAALYFKGHGVPQSMSQAARWYQRAAEGGVPEAQYRIGVMLLEGEGVNEDAFEALYWLKQAAHSGHREAKTVFHHLLAHPEPLEC